MSGRWFFTCPTCRTRYSWEGAMQPIPPCPECLKRLKTPEPAILPTMPAKTITVGGPSESAAEAFEICDEIESMMNDIPEAGEVFAGSVSDKASSIRRTVEANNHATPAQISALENMRDGLSRWIRD